MSRPAKPTHPLVKLSSSNLNTDFSIASSVLICYELTTASQTSDESRRCLLKHQRTKMHRIITHAHDFVPEVAKIHEKTDSGCKTLRFYEDIWLYALIWLFDNRIALVKFIGKIGDAIWVGLEFASTQKDSMDCRRFFQCRTGCGMLVLPRFIKATVKTVVEPYKLQTWVNSCLKCYRTHSDVKSNLATLLALDQHLQLIQECGFSPDWAGSVKKLTKKRLKLTALICSNLVNETSEEKTCPELLALDLLYVEVVLLYLTKGVGLYRDRRVQDLFLHRKKLYNKIQSITPFRVTQNPSRFDITSTQLKFLESVDITLKDRPFDFPLSKSNSFSKPSHFVYLHRLVTLFIEHDPSLLELLCLKDSCFYGQEHRFYLDVCKHYHVQPLEEYHGQDNSTLNYLIYTLQSLQDVDIFASVEYKKYEEQPPSLKSIRDTDLYLQPMRHEFEACRKRLYQLIEELEEAAHSEAWSRQRRDELIFQVETVENEFDECEIQQLMLDRTYDEKLQQIAKLKEDHQIFREDVKSVKAYFEQFLVKNRVDGRQLDRQCKLWQRKVSAVEEEVRSGIDQSRVLEAEVMQLQFRLNDRKLKRQSTMVCIDELNKALANFQKSDKQPQLDELQQSLWNTNRRLSQVSHLRYLPEPLSPLQEDVWDEDRDRRKETIGTLTSLQEYDTFSLPDTVETLSILTSTPETPSNFHVPFDLLNRQHKDIVQENTKLQKTLANLNLQIEQATRN